MARASARFARRQADDVAHRLDRGQPRRRYLLQHPVRTEQRTGQPLALRPAAVERALRPGEAAVRQPAARPALPRDGQAVLRLCAAAADLAPHHHRTCAALAGRLSPQPGDARVLEIPRRRRRRAVMIRVESPRDARVRELTAALDAHLSSLYPPESNHFLDIEQLAAREVRFFVARRDDAPVGCGALRIDRSGYGEVKRMYVAPEVRGQGVGRAPSPALKPRRHARDWRCCVWRPASARPRRLRSIAAAATSTAGPSANTNPTRSAASWRKN